MIPASSGYMIDVDVVFRGRNSACTLFNVGIVSLFPWQAALSRSNRTLRSFVSLVYSSNWFSRSKKIDKFIHGLLLDRYITPSDYGSLELKHLGRFDFPMTSKGNFSDLSMFVHAINVTRSFCTFLPGSLLGPILVVGAILKSNPNSSAFQTSFKAYVLILVQISGSDLSTAASSASPLSPWDLYILKLRCFLNFQIHSLLNFIDTRFSGSFAAFNSFLSSDALRFRTKSVTFLRRWYILWTQSGSSVSISPQVTFFSRFFCDVLVSLES